MSFFSKLMGGTFESNRDEGDGYFRGKQFGQAKLSFERALSKARDASQADLEALKDKVRSCKLELARIKLADADAEAAESDLVRAGELLDEALEICEEQDIVEAVQQRRKRYEAEAVRHAVGDERELSEDELLAVIAGTWSDDQADEYASLPDGLRTALIAGHDGNHEKAVELFEELLGRADLEVEPVYLHLELARHLAALDKHERALAELDAFIEKVGESEDAEAAQIEALSLKAGSLSRLERHDEAKEQLIRATQLAPTDPGVFFSLGVFLRRRGEYDAALGALGNALALMGQLRQDFRIMREIGFTHLARADKEEAMRSLKSVVDHLASRDMHDELDPEASLALAKLYEEDGRLMEAADLLRHLAHGKDTRNHFAYNIEAARLLGRASAKKELVERYTARAVELAKSPEQQTALRELLGVSPD